MEKTLCNSALLGARFVGMKSLAKALWRDRGETLGRQRLSREEWGNSRWAGAMGGGGHIKNVLQ